MPSDRNSSVTESRYSNSTRRQFLGTAALGAIGAAAGCLGGDSGGSETGGDGDSDTTAGGSTGSAGSSGSGGAELSFTSGPSNSLAFGMGNAMTSVIQDNSDLTINIASGTSGQSVASVVTGASDLGFGTTLVGTRAKNNEGTFSQVEKSQTLLQLPSFYFILLGGFVGVDSDVEHFGDLEGASFAPGPSGASYWDVWELALQKGMSMDALEIENSGVNQLSDLLSAGRVAAVGGPTLSNYVTPGFMQQTLSQNDVRMLSYQDSTLQAIEDDPMTPVDDVEKSRLDNVDEFAADGDTTPMVSANYVLWTSDAVPADAVYTLLKTAWENTDALGETHAAYEVWADESWFTRNMTTEVPVHPGAVEFLEEIDVWSDEYTAGSL
ncbi:TAXI family TRAP transporter solute-binding subunit [Halobellus sp. GM3]|uniref:TAXI family TRAP transporter solute-binding subunit n=1 Tax=Halobellus sp. GM3 TaxID=3458410 RepID=UPI00403D8F6D